MRTVLLVALALAVAGPSAPGRSTAPTSGGRVAGPDAALQLAGDAAPRRWPNAGGGASRSGVGTGRPLRVQPDRSWSRRIRGEIEDGPLVWNDLVVVSAKETDRSRRLYCLDLASGRDLVPALPVATSVALAPSLWSRAVVVRRSERELAAFQVGDRRGTPFWSWRAASAVGPPLAVDQDVYATTDEGVVRLRLGRRDPVWVSPGRFRGAVSVRGEHAYAVRYDERGSAHLVQLDAATGRPLSARAVGHHGGRVPEQGVRPRVALLGTTVVVHHAEPIWTDADGEATAAALELDASGGLGRGASEAVQVEGTPVGWNGGYAARLASTGGESALGLRGPPGAGTTGILATASSAPDVLEDAVHVVRVASVLYAGRTGVDLVDGRVLWRLPHEARVRTVPAGAGVLAVVGGSTLEGWAPAAAGETEAELRRLEASLGARLADEYLALAERAKRARDPDLLRRLVQTARAWGAAGARVAGLEQHVALLDQQRALVEDPTVGREVRAAEAELATFVADGLWQRAHELTTRRSEPELRDALLEEVLRLAPEHPAAGAWVQGELPSDLRALGRFPAAAWLDFLRVTRRVPVEVHARRAPAAGDPAAEALASARSEWRPDLVAYESAHLAVLTPASTPPDAVARCLATGELVCDALAETFAAAPRGSAGKLVLHLFSSRAEYLRFAEDHVEGGAGLSWTAGHFDPVARVSRIYLPEDVAGWHSVLRTYAHELTHHWLQARFVPAGAGPPAAQPGYWIVEGFACLFEEFVFDLEAGSWSSENPRNHRLDVLARAPADRALAWEELFTLSHAAFQDLDGEVRAKVAPRWVLGRVELLSERAFFYYQAAAAAQALFHADGGRHRAALLDYVAAYYGGRRAELDVARALGRSPAELGRLAREHAGDR